MNLGALWATLGVDAKGLETGVVAMRQFEAKVNTSAASIQQRLNKTSTAFRNVGRI